MMERSKSGGFRLFDVMILIAATAAGLSLIDWPHLNDRQLNASRSHGLYFYEAEIAIAVCPFWVMWTVASLVIRLRSPRPSIRRLTLQPGWVATLSVLVCTPIPLALNYFENFYGPARNFEKLIPYHFLQELPRWSAYVVAGAWLTLWLNRRWRPEASAIDRFGRVLGFGWIAFYLLNRITQVLYWMGLDRLY